MGIPTLIDLLLACVKDPGRISAKTKGYKIHEQQQLIKFKAGRKVLVVLGDKNNT